MKGYDILLTSYYDHYIVDYETFEKWDYEKEKFHIPQGKINQIVYVSANEPFSILSNVIRCGQRI